MNEPRPWPGYFVHPRSYKIAVKATSACSFRRSGAERLGQLIAVFPARAGAVAWEQREQDALRGRLAQANDDLQEASNTRYNGVRSPSFTRLVQFAVAMISTSSMICSSVK